MRKTIAEIFVSIPSWPTWHWLSVSGIWPLIRGLMDWKNLLIRDVSLPLLAYKRERWLRENSVVERWRESVTEIAVESLLLCNFVLFSIIVKLLLSPPMNVGNCQTTLNLCVLFLRRWRRYCLTCGWCWGWFLGPLYDDEVVCNFNFFVVTFGKIFVICWTWLDL